MTLEQNKMLVLGGMLYLEEVRDTYLSSFSSVYDRVFDTTTELAYANVEGVIAKCIRVDSKVNSSVIINYLGEYYDKIPPLNKVLKNDYATIVEELVRHDKYTPNICNNILTQTVAIRAAQELKAVVNDPLKYTKVDSAVKKYQDTVNKAKVSKASKEFRVFNPAEDMEDLLVYKERVQTGVSVIDSLLQGGIAVGEHIGILGPTGGGKSVLANQLKCNLAIQGFNVLAIQTEQDIEGDIAEREYTYLTGEPISTFRSKSYHSLSEEVKAKIKVAKSILGRIRDASLSRINSEDCEKGIPLVIKLLEDTYKTFPFSYLLMDWLGSLVTSFVVTGQGGRMSYQENCEKVISAINRWASPKDITVVWFHQTTTEAQAREPAYKPKKEDSFGYRSFAQKLFFCLQIGTASSIEGGDKICYLVLGKGRMQAVLKTEIVVKLVGDYMRMEEPPSGEYILDKQGQFVHKDTKFDTEDFDSDEDDDDGEGGYDYKPSKFDKFANGFK